MKPSADDQNNEYDDPLALTLMIRVVPMKRLLVDHTTRYQMSEKQDDYRQKVEEFIPQKNEKYSCEGSSSNQTPMVEHAKQTNKPASKRPRSSTDDDQVENTKKKKKIHVGSPEISNETTDRLKEFITGEMKGSDLKLVIQKVLYATDLDKHQNRLSMPIKQLETLEFLTADEKQLLDDNREFEVPLVGPTLRMHTTPMKLKLWHLKTTCNYVLRTNWNHFVEKNREDLTVNTRVQVWSFRRDEQLCFALACVGRAD